MKPRASRKLKKETPPPTVHLAPESKFQRALPALLTGLCLLSLVWGLKPPSFNSVFDLTGFGQLPVLNGGRIKPLDTIARTGLLELSGKQALEINGRNLHALGWLIDLMFRSDQVSTYPIFQIDNPDVLGALGIPQTNQRRFAFSILEPHLDEIDKQGTQAEQVKSDQRSRYQTAMLDLSNQLNLYQKLRNTLQIAGAEKRVAALEDFEQRVVPAVLSRLDHVKRGGQLPERLMQDLEQYHFLDRAAEFYALAPESRWRPEPWMTFGEGVLERLKSDAYHPGILAYAAMSDAWRAEDPAAFNQALRTYQDWLMRKVPHDVIRARYEYLFNYFEPFYRSLQIYVLAFLLVFLSWLVWPRTFSRAAYAFLILAFVVHTTGLISRMILQGRPPVTNLYSSAIFVGWVAVVLGIILERLYRNSMGTLVASVIGFLTLIIAQNLATTGDTLEMMRAVLDSNFWLATHVVCITIGYGSTFLSGFLGTVYLIRRWVDRQWNETAAENLERMTYGVICFATFFSFLGTVLGGIWADQSWGRFWGWDPKENGALMIVLWNTFILHARLGGYIDRRKTMMLAVFGNVVTAFSWFGVNMLGIGLHSYGFMEQAFIWLIIFSISQMLIIALGFVQPRSRKAS